MSFAQWSKINFHCVHVQCNFHFAYVCHVFLILLQTITNPSDCHHTSVKLFCGPPKVTWRNALNSCVEIRTWAKSICKCTADHCTSESASAPSETECFGTTTYTESASAPQHTQRVLLHHNVTESDHNRHRVLLHRLKIERAFAPSIETWSPRAHTISAHTNTPCTHHYAGTNYAHTWRQVWGFPSNLL